MIFWFVACYIFVFSPSSRLASERTNPLLEISPVLKPCIYATTPIISHISLVREHLHIRSKRLFLSVEISRVTLRLRRSEKSLRREKEVSKRSLKAFTSADMAERQRLLVW